jgi:outer membrane protein insertion porin family
MVALRRSLIAGSFALIAIGISLTIGSNFDSNGLFAQVPGGQSLSPLPPYSLGPPTGPASYGVPAGAGSYGVLPEPSAAPVAPSGAPLYGGGGPQMPSLTGASGNESIVKKVRVEGNFSTEVSKMPKLGTREGQPFDARIVQEDVRTLASSRKFLDVRSKMEPSPDGMTVIFQVVERPTIDEVTFVGNQDFRSQTLRKKSELEKKQPLDPYAVEEGRRRVEAYYKEKGYSHIEITTLEGTKPSDRKVVFLIDEGKSQRIFWTSFDGNTIASGSRLRTQISQRPGFLWLFGGKVDRKKIEEDEQKLYAYYRGLGYFKAKIGHDLDFNESKTWLTLRYTINEGPRYSIRSVAFLGNEHFKVGELNKNLEQIAGKPFDQTALDHDLGGIRDVYGCHGYVFADIQKDIRLSEDKPEMDLVYNISEGKQYRVGRININIGGDDPHTAHATILDRMSLRPGDIVDTKKLRDDERRLKFSSIFNSDPSKGGPPRIAFVKSDAEKDDRDVANRNGGKSSGSGNSGSPDNYRGQSPDNEVLDVFPACDARGNAIAVFVPRAQSAIRSAGVNIQQARFQDPGPNNWSSNSNTQSANDARAAWGIPSGSSTPNYLPPGARPLPAYSVTSPPGFSAPPVGVPAVSSSPYSNAAFQAPPSTPSFNGAQPDATVYGAPQVYGPPMAGVPPVVGQSVPPAQVYGQPSGQPTYNPPMFPSGGGNAFGPGPNTNGAVPFVQAPPSNLQPQPGPAPGGGVGYEIFGQPGSTVDLNVAAQETMTGRLMLGVGVNSDAGLVGNFVLDEQNFDITRLPRSWDDIRNGTAWRGDGERLRIEANPGTLVQRYAITYQIPYLNHTPIGLTTSAFYFTRIYEDWDEGRVGGNVRLSYLFTPDFSGHVGFDGERVDIYNPHKPTPPELERALGQNDRYGFSVGVAHDTRDSPFLPTQGHLLSADFEQVVGTFEYPRLNLEGRQYFLLHQRADGSGRHTLGIGGDLGITGSNTPIYDNYFAGGFSSLRGWAFRGASPRVENVEVGGQFMALGTAEYMFPITADDALRGVVFCDFGTVERTLAFHSDQFRAAPGFGLRINVPAMGPAPIALDLAFPVASAPGDQIQNFSFSLGIAR